MSKSFIIEVGDDPAGIVIRNDGEHEFRFHAASAAYQSLEGRRFPTPASAEKAAIRTARPASNSPLRRAS